MPLHAGHESVAVFTVPTPLPRPTISTWSPHDSGWKSENTSIATVVLLRKLFELLQPGATWLTCRK